MATTTPQQALPVPDETDDPDIPADLMSLATAIEKKLVQVYNSVSDRDTVVTSPVEGQFCVLKDVNKIFCYLDSAWVQIYPVTLPAITSGTTAPNNATGANGDIYFQV